MGQILGAFAGAFFAFIFAIIYLHFDEKFKARKKHYNALVGLEFNFNMLMNGIGNNQYRIGEIISALEKTSTEPTLIALTWHKLRQLDIDKRLVDNLLNINLKNDLLNYFVEIVKLNSDFENLNSMYQESKMAFFNKSISPDDYRNNAMFYVDRLKDLNKFLAASTDETKGIAVKVRLLLKDKVKFLWYRPKYSKDGKYADKLEDEYPKELKKLNGEIEEMERESQQEKEKIIS